jgi:hypothetical protein
MLPRSWALASQALGWDRGILTSWDGQRLPFFLPVFLLDVSGPNFKLVFEVFWR